jgi:hypothetical protein
MKLSLSSCFRLVVALGVLSIITAIMISRLSPRPCRLRVMSNPTWAVLNGHHFLASNSAPLILDLTTGDCRKLESRDGDNLEYAMFSPWRDEQGNAQVVGRWHRRHGDEGDMLCEDFGLARYSFPDGEVLDRIPTDAIPSGRPCWFPGTSARILFASGDGQLFRFSFEDSSDGYSLGCEDMTTPRVLPWKSDVPGDGAVFLKDPFWSTDPRLGRKLIAAVSYRRIDGGRAFFLSSEIWWLELSPDATSIVDSGRLTRPERSGEHRDEFMPSVSTAPDGTILMAYLTRSEGRQNVEMRIVPIEFGASTDHPIARASESVRIAQNCSSSPPVFSADGRWIYGLIRPEKASAHIERFSVAAALASRHSVPLRLASLIRDEGALIISINRANSGSGPLFRRTSRRKRLTFPLQR